MIKITLDPLSNIQYSSFYIYALQSVFGHKSIYFSNRPFKDLPFESRIERGLLFTVKRDDRPEMKYYIHGEDAYKIKDEAIYDWCDLYASVNANFAKTPNRKKLVSLAPSFAIRPWGTGMTVIEALYNAYHYLESGHFHRVKTFLGNYYRLFNRPFYSELTPEPSKTDYCFFCSTLWYNNEYNKNDTGVNARRANFIRACKEIDGIHFEGGFVVQEGRSSIELFNDCISGTSYPYYQWLQKTKQSFVVFNTPAFWDCHGWKLGEYLALGKAIISTPLSNDLPYPLEHGVNIHFVDNTKESIKGAVNYIFSNHEYKMRLERGAREYWETYCTPERSLALMGITQ